MHHHMHHHHGKNRSAEASITSGIVFTLGFGIAWAVTGWWFMVFPMVFAGVMPLAEGLRRLITSRGTRPAEVKQQKPKVASVEKQILVAAKEEKGIVTPALIALKTDLSIKEAEQKLDEMAQSGYTMMQIRENGRIEYEFPEFMPRLDQGPGEQA